MVVLLNIACDRDLNFQIFDEIQKEIDGYLQKRSFYFLQMYFNLFCAFNDTQLVLLKRVIYSQPALLAPSALTVQNIHCKVFYSQ